ncbi:MAG: hypothetical protein V4805_13540 [Pseudomonadota bacterium]
MELNEKINLIVTNKDLAAFVDAMRIDLLANPSSWENATLERFLEAMAAWSRSMEHVYKNTGRSFPEQPSWKMMAEILYAAKIYE